MSALAFSCQSALDVCALPLKWFFYITPHWTFVWKIFYSKKCMNVRSVIIKKHSLLNAMIWYEKIVPNNNVLPVIFILKEIDKRTNLHEKITKTLILPMRISFNNFLMLRAQVHTPYCCYTPNFWIFWKL